MQRLLNVLAVITSVSLVILGLLFASPHVAHAASTAATHANDSFPSDASWTWSDDNYQAWIGPSEYDDISGSHYNLHIQPLDGGFDYANYHITYNGIQQDANGSDVYQWQVYDSESGNLATYTQAAGLDEATAAEYAMYDIAFDAGTVIGDGALTAALIEDTIASTVVVDALIDVLLSLVLILADTPLQQTQSLA